MKKLLTMTALVLISGGVMAESNHTNSRSTSRMDPRFEQPRSQVQQPRDQGNQGMWRHWQNQRNNQEITKSSTPGEMYQQHMRNVERKADKEQRKSRWREWLDR